MGEESRLRDIEGGSWLHCTQFQTREPMCVCVRVYIMTCVCTHTSTYIYHFSPQLFFCVWILDTTIRYPYIYTHIHTHTHSGTYIYHFAPQLFFCVWNLDTTIRYPKRQPFEQRMTPLDRDSLAGVEKGCAHRAF